MIPGPHRLSHEQFAALARGGGGAAVARVLAAARRSRTLLLIRFMVDATDDVIARQAYEVLRDVHKRAPEQVGRVVDHPSVGAWVTRTALRLCEGDSAAADGLACVALAAAVRAGMSATVSMRARETIPLPSLGTVHVPVRGEVTVRCGAAGAEIATEARIPRDPFVVGPAWQPLDRIVVDDDRHGKVFLLDPWVDQELPPDMQVCAEVEVSIWQERIAAGWDLLVNDHTAVAEELASAVTVLTPLHTPQEGVSSATVADAFGCLFLSLPADGRTAAVTLAHELQHTKLIALMDLFPLLVPDSAETFYAPWRNDPRPLVGLLHGTYAYLGIAAFWRRQRTRETSAGPRLFADVEFARWRNSALDATHTMLTSRRLTTLGARFVAGMRDVLEKWCAEPVPGEALAAAARLSSEHHNQWLTVHGQKGFD